MAEGRTVRFGQLVKAAGKPHPATLWAGDPEKDPDFRKAMEENRIVSIHLVNVGTKKEAGEIGFLKGRDLNYLIFPKALAFAEGTKVIGIKFEMLEDAPVKDPVKVKAARRERKVEKVKTVKGNAGKRKKGKGEEEQKETSGTKQEEMLTFRVTVEFKARFTRDFEVEAKTATGAIDVALQEAKGISPGKVEWETEALEVRKK
jgi:hypothetical protein